VAEAGCGIALDTSDVGRIAASVRRLADPALRARMGEAGRAAALTRFDWQGEAARLVALYERLLRQDSAAAAGLEEPKAIAG
jgi:glycosyltransferase involved in cell wall biosynthesis